MEARRHEILAIVALTIAILLTLALASHQFGLTKNLVGPLGHRVAYLMTKAFGITSWLLPLEAALLASRLFRQRSALLGVATMASTLVMVMVGCALTHLITDGARVFGGHLPGGAIGELFGEVLRSILGYAGTLIVGFSVMMTMIIIRTPWTLREFADRLSTAVVSLFQRSSNGVLAVIEAWREARQIEEEQERLTSPRIIVAGGKEPEQIELPVIQEVNKIRLTPPKAEPIAKPQAAASKPGTDGPKIIAPKATRQAPEALTAGPKSGKGAFKLPPISLLDEVDTSDIHVDTEILRQNAELLTENSQRTVCVVMSTRSTLGPLLRCTSSNHRAEPKFRRSPVWQTTSRWHWRRRRYESSHRSLAKLALDSSFPTKTVRRFICERYSKIDAGSNTRVHFQSRLVKTSKGNPCTPILPRCLIYWSQAQPARVRALD